jgi:hypothetical protein
MLHPEVQRKGQEEISRVCDSNQLPSYDDADSLPYVTAIALEVLRWANVTPIGTVHTLLMLTGPNCSYFAGAPRYNDTDDVYNQYFVPGGSIIIMNLWSATFCLRRPLTHIIMKGA